MVMEVALPGLLGYAEPRYRSGVGSTKDPFTRACPVPRWTASHQSDAAQRGHKRFDDVPTEGRHPGGRIRIAHPRTFPARVGV